MCCACEKIRLWSMPMDVCLFSKLHIFLSLFITPLKNIWSKSKSKIVFFLYFFLYDISTAFKASHEYGFCYYLECFLFWLPCQKSGTQLQRRTSILVWIICFSPSQESTAAHPPCWLACPTFRSCCLTCNIGLHHVLFKDASRAHWF